MGYDSNDYDDGSIERCPCCGAKADVRCWSAPFTMSTPITNYYVRCEKCGLMTHPYGKSVAGAIADWNHRVERNKYE